MNKNQMFGKVFKNTVNTLALPFLVSLLTLALLEAVGASASGRSPAVEFSHTIIAGGIMATIGLAITIILAGITQMHYNRQLVPIPVRRRRG